MPHRLTVVVSQSRSQNPKKRDLEEQIVAGLLGERGIDVTVLPNLYDLKPEGSGLLCLSGITGDVVICSWLYPRAARWILDRNQIRGQEGSTLLKSLGESEEQDDEQEQTESNESPDDKLRVIDQLELPARRIYCLDLRAYDDPAVFRNEVKRIARELATPTVELKSWINGSPKPEQMERYLAADSPDLPPPTSTPPLPTLVDEDAARRWYPVIDLSRCTNCLECIDFCLFGVYGIDARETILVEQPDNCRQGCPACSRVCPENAIIFPQHKTPAIAGSADVAGTLKINLSQLFGAPDPGASGAEKASEVAARERDEQLLLAGREAIGVQGGIPKRHATEQGSDCPKDELDNLIDSLDELDF